MAHNPTHHHRHHRQHPPSQQEEPPSRAGSVSGQMAVAVAVEPAESGGTTSNPNSETTSTSTTPTATPSAQSSTGQRPSPSHPRQASTSATTTSASIASPSLPPLRKQPSSQLVPTTSSPSTANNSPQTSRNTSPIRRESRPQTLAQPQTATQPSAAAIQRALSAASVPQLQAPGGNPGPVTDAVSRLPRASKSAEGTAGNTTPQWPVSPRLKSPPPSGPNSRRGSATAAASQPQQQPLQQKKKKMEAESGAAAPSINVQVPTPQQAPTPPPKQQGSGGEETRKQEQSLQAPAKAPSRGPSGKSVLETVQENSADSVGEPPAAAQAAADLKPLTRISEEDQPVSKKEGHDGGERQTQPAESGSESAGSKVDLKRGRRQSLTQPSKTASRSSTTTAGKSSGYPPLHSAKSRQNEGKQNMTVETETVQSIPQSALNAGDRIGSGRNDPGSIRLKPSNETIRPKKERKKPSQKARSLNQGTASSKADIFEARVARDVEEANYTSDSDETFVYESNPPEPQRRPRHHSRTPSVTSSHSIAEQPRSGLRGYGGIGAGGDADEGRRVAGKRSMKFSSNPYNDIDSPDSKNGTVRSSHQARHIGRFGRGGSQMFTDPQQTDSPFTQASKLRTNHLSVRNSSRPNSPRSPQSLVQQQQQYRPSGLFTSNRKQEASSFDFDGEGADDERTPLVGTVRTPRSNRHTHHRRLPSRPDSARSPDAFFADPSPRHPTRSRLHRCLVGFCLVGFCLVAAVLLSAVAFLLLSNRPLYEVRIRRIENVLASEQELMLDLLVGAVNPNALGVVVAEMDVNVFAKSRFVGGEGVEMGLGVEEGEREEWGRLRRRKGRRWRKRGLRLEAEEEGGGRQRPDAKDGNPNPWQDLSGHWHAPGPLPHHHDDDDDDDDGDGPGHGHEDDGTDPMPPSPGDPDPDDDLDTDAQTMLLGRILHFDTALAFSGSPLKRHLHYSLGEVRLLHPGGGNQTGDDDDDAGESGSGGSPRRWEKVVRHPFELIVRGVLRYRLPVSGRGESVGVSGSVVVYPEEGVDGRGRMRVGPVPVGRGWEWVDWPDGDGDGDADGMGFGGRLVEVGQGA